MMHKKRKLKTFISLFIVAIFLLSLIMMHAEEDSYYAATVIKSFETTKKRTVGHKVEGAEYYDELWDKFSVIAVDNGGGSGEGGGAGDSNSSNAGNGGAYEDAGGIFGQAAGVGQGSGSTKNQSGVGSGSSGGSTGSVTADAYRRLKANIEESKAESLAKVLESAKNAESVAASIAAREKEQESIKKRLIQESVRASIEAAEMQRQKIFETPVYVEANVRQNTYVADIETRTPTSARRDSYGAYDNKVPPSRAPREPRTKAVEEPKSNIIIREETITPVSNEVTYYDLSNISPSANNEIATQYENNISIPVADENTTYYENNDVNIPTSVSQVVENDISAPTGATYENNTELVETLSTIETFDSPLLNEETSVVVEEEVTEVSTMQEETKDYSDEENGKGSKGGQDAEADEDLKGEAGENESQGNADERGQYQLETKGEYAGKKIFELKQNGNIGFEPEHLSVAGLKNFMISGITLLLLVGALLFILGNDTKQKHNYF